MADKPVADKAAKIDTGLLREIAAILREADLGEIEIEQGGLRVRVSRSGPPVVHSSGVVHAHPAPTAAAAPAAPPAPAPKPSAPAGDHPGAVKSPMVGTVYLAAEAGAAPFVKVGDAVKEGQTLLLVEAMKTFNPVLAPRAGRIAQIIVANEQPVEYGEALIVIE
ncbi:MAG: acetyl-CoA carboxylase biotin carboxyl carrier protein [Alphaproteobacteria bacterium]|nr:acetyl-CoA carboxylase biotin carboxyl carrier protein [Alphaproteobacteria bacterium]